MSGAKRINPGSEHGIRNWINCKTQSDLLYKVIKYWFSKVKHLAGFVLQPLLEDLG